MRSGLLTRVVAFAYRTHHSALVATAVLSGGLVNFAVGQELQPQLGQVQEFRKTDTGKIQFYSKSGQEAESAPPFIATPTGKTGTATPVTVTPVAATGQPQPYQRNAADAPIKNYYTELFSTSGEKPVRGAVQTIPTTMSQEPGPILNAEYQTQPEQAASQNVIPASGTEVQSADLPEWARDMKSRNLFDPNATAPVAEIAPASATVISSPKLTVPGTAPVVETLPLNLGEIVAGPQTPSVKIEWTAGSDINVGQECECELVVTNVGKCNAFDVQVSSSFPASVRLLDASPKPSSVNRTLVWTLGNLAEGETRSIKVKLIPSQQGPLSATAQVKFSGASQAEFVVREPLIDLKMEGPQQVMIGDPASHSVTITNPGNGIAKNVKLEAVIPSGLEHIRGERLIMEVGSLNPSESRTIRLALAAVTGGQHVVHVAATADGGLVKEADTTISVIAPSLQAEITGPGLRYKGRAATYNLTVHNNGTVATSNVRLMHKIPEGFQFVSASRGATFDEPTRILSWFIGRLDADQTADMQVELTAQKIGEHVHFVRATSEHGSMSDSQVVTRVDGSSSLLLEITDLNDPVEVGVETAYEIKIVNEGSASAQKVGLSCELPEGVRFLKAEGPSPHVVDGNLVMFQPLDEVAANKSARFRVHVIGNVEGNLRFRARMTSAATSEPLTFEELTRFYGDQR